MLTQGKDDNEAGRKKDKQDTVNPIAREYYIGVWRSLVSRMVRDHEAAGSSPATPTKYALPMVAQ